MDPPVGTDEWWERVGVGAAQLLDLAVTKEVLHDGVLTGELLERIGIGRRARLGPLHRREPELVEEDATKLGRRVDVELLLRGGVDPNDERVALLGQIGAQLLEEVAVHGDAHGFHLGEHADEGAFDSLVELGEVAAGQGVLEELPQREHRVRAPTGLFDRRVAVEVERAVGNIGGANLEAQMTTDEIIQDVGPLPRLHQVRHHRGVEVERLERHRRQPVGQLLGAMGHEGAPAVAEQTAERRGHLRVGQHLTVDVGGITLGGRDPEAHQRGTAGGADPARLECVAALSGRQRVEALDRRGRRGDVIDHDLDDRPDGLVLGGRIDAKRLDEARIEGAELELVEQRAHRLAVKRSGLELGRVEVDVAVEPESHHLPVLEHPLTRLTEVLALFRGQLLEMFVDAFEVAVGGDELGRRLLADAGNPGQVVAGVTAHRRVVGVLRGRDAGAFEDPGLVIERVVGHAPFVVEHPQVRVGHELIGVAVAGDDDRVDPVLGRAGGDRTDHIIGFDSLELDRGDPQRVEHLADQRELGGKEVGRLGTVRLVLGVHLVAKRRRGGVERDHDVVGMLITDDLHEHRGEPVHRVRHRAGRRRQVGGQCVERPVRERVTVEQEELHAATVPIWSGAARCRRQQERESEPRTASTERRPRHSVRGGARAARCRRQQGAELWREGSVEHQLGGLVHLDPTVHRLGLEEPPRRASVQAMAIAQDVFRPVGDLATFEPLRQVAHVVLQVDDLLVASQRDLDGGDQVALLEWLDDVADRAGVAGLLDEVTLGESGEDEHRGQPLARDVSGGGEPTEARHLDVQQRDVRAKVAHELDRLVAAAGLADDLIALLLEKLLEIETNDGLVFGDHHSGLGH